MIDFLGAVLAFPTVLFSALLVVVVGYWIIVLTGLFDLEDGEAAWLGLGGMPIGVSLSLLVATAWLLSLISGQILGGLPYLSLVIALAGAWLATRLAAIPMRRLFPDARQPSRTDFVGQHCVIRTGQVTPAFGQAEVTATDGSSAVIQVRTTGDDRLARGDNALIFDYAAEGEFFLVMPYEKDH
ncbi:hypothetical protein OIE66_41355 [Nonomuraea sp. NBC_01738]|uniref:hypothetical protein n=1 Tax=Nonomuraea sp. NBC_01738 TaxID=2976003 RepID=UPI002E0E12AB|nr:hypothetical protein OIE66_41355 [Nonomuraea sp. NBC_01738]